MVFSDGGSVRQGLPDVLLVDVRELLPELSWCQPAGHEVDHVCHRDSEPTNCRSSGQHAWIEARVSPEWTIVVPNQLNVDVRKLEKAGRHVVLVDLKSARDEDGLNAIMAGVPAPAVILVPHWGADDRFSGQELADSLNSLSQRWRVLKTFGTNDVRVNYRPATPRGDPAFSIAILK